MYVWNLKLSCTYRVERQLPWTIKGEKQTYSPIGWKCLSLLRYHVIVAGYMLLCAEHYPMNARSRCRYIHMCTYMHSYTYAYTSYMHIYTIYTIMYRHTYTCIQIYVYKFIVAYHKHIKYTCKHTLIDICKYAHTHTYKCKHTYAHKHIFIPLF